MYTAFDFCLPEWASCAAAKADEQVDRVLEMEEEKHKQKNLLETNDGGEIDGCSLGLGYISNETNIFLLFN